MASLAQSFPRKSPVGWVDGGITISDPAEKCPNCKSSAYRQTVSIEECTDCGLYCDYWGGGANDVYKSMMERRWRQQEEEAEKISRENSWD